MQQIGESVDQQLPEVASIEEFIEHVYGENAPTNGGGRPLGLRLGIEKRRRGKREKFYRLIWVGRGQACLAKECQDEYQTKTPALAAGYELAAALGVEFDPNTR
jgi:hypothetical protein